MTTGSHEAALYDKLLVLIVPDNFCRSLTALHASSEEVTEWTGRDDPGKSSNSSQRSEGENRLLQSQEASSSGSGQLKSIGEKYNFVCECFFMTARVLNLGLLKALSDFKHLVQVAKAIKTC